MLTPSMKGGIAELAIAAEAVKLGVFVLRPVVEGHRYDLMFDVDGLLLRVQCKWACRKGDVVVVNLRTSRLTPHAARLPAHDIRTRRGGRDRRLLRGARCLLPAADS
jgi:PD-(D/E)XK endonuclease